MHNCEVFCRLLLVYCIALDVSLEPIIDLSYMFAPAPQSIKYLRFFLQGWGGGGGVFLALRGEDVPSDFPYSTTLGSEMTNT